MLIFENLPEKVLDMYNFPSTFRMVGKHAMLQQKFIYCENYLGNNIGTPEPTDEALCTGKICRIMSIIHPDGSVLLLCEDGKCRLVDLYQFAQVYRISIRDTQKRGLHP